MHCDRLVAPEADDQKPAAHEMQPSIVLNPDDSWYFPATHAIQTLLFDAPNADDHNPAPQLTQPSDD